MLTIIEVELKGSKYPVRYTTNALCEFEEITGKNFLQIFKEMDTRCLRALAFTGLRHGHDYHYRNNPPFKLTIAEVGELCGISDLKQFIPIAAQFITGDRKPEENGQSTDKPENPGE